MFRIILLSLVFCFVIPQFIIPERAIAADGKILDATVDRYMEAAAEWEPRIKQAATSMFWILAAISMVFTWGYSIFAGQKSL